MYFGLFFCRRAFWRNLFTPKGRKYVDTDRLWAGSPGQQLPSAPACPPHHPVLLCSCWLMFSCLPTTREASRAPSLQFVILIPWVWVVVSTDVLVSIWMLGLDKWGVSGLLQWGCFPWKEGLIQDSAQLIAVRVRELSNTLGLPRAHIFVTQYRWIARKTILKAHIEPGYCLAT